MVAPFLEEASETCAEVIGAPVDLAARIRRGEETTLDTYAEAVAMIVAMEMAQIRLLKDFFGIEYAQARLAYGYSLGEVAALVAAGVIEMRHALRVPSVRGKRFAELARDSTLGVLFCAARPWTPTPSNGSACGSIWPGKA